jgi:dTDP-4-dehydrorhamnose reductase
VKILVLGAAGMLGFAVHRVLGDAGCDVIGGVRGPTPPDSAWCRGLRYVTNLDVDDFAAVARAVDRTGTTLVVNAVGVNAPGNSGAASRTLLAVNSMFPRKLDRLAASLGIYWIHFSTDGVFAGHQGSYNEASLPDATDLYGMSKYLGEPIGSRALVLRTSLIGRAIAGGDSLVDWFLRQSGTVHGFRRAIFSGLPVNEIATVLLQRVLPRGEPLTGLFHLSSDPISKFSLLGLIRTEWQRNDLQVVPDDSIVIDRSLDSSLLRRTISYVPPPWPELVAEMRAFYTRLEMRAKKP